MIFLKRSRIFEQKENSKGLKHWSSKLFKKIESTIMLIRRVIVLLSIFITIVVASPIRHRANLQLGTISDSGFNSKFNKFPKKHANGGRRY